MCVAAPPPQQPTPTPRSDTVLRALSLHERTQLQPEDVACVASIDSAQK